MPYELSPSGRGYFVITKDTGRRHSTRVLSRPTAVRQLRALYANVKDADKRR